MAAQKIPSKKRNILTAIALVAVLAFVGFQAFVLFFGNSSAFSGGSFSMSNFNMFMHWGVNAASSSEGTYSHLPLNTNGFNQLVEWDRSINETSDLQKQVAGFDALIPCCGFKLTSADPNADCQCGHHLALRGLIKYGLTNGWTRAQIQQEINQWKPVFYPVCAQNPKLCDL